MDAIKCEYKFIFLCSETAIGIPYQRMMISSCSFSQFPARAWSIAAARSDALTTSPLTRKIGVDLIPSPVANAIAASKSLWWFAVERHFSNWIVSNPKSAAKHSVYQLHKSHCFHRLNWYIDRIGIPKISPGRWRSRRHSLHRSTPVLKTPWANKCNRSN